MFLAMIRLYDVPDLVAALYCMAGQGGVLVRVTEGWSPAEVKVQAGHHSNRVQVGVEI